MSLKTKTAVELIDLVLYIQAVTPPFLLSEALSIPIGEHITSFAPDFQSIRNDCLPNLNLSLETNSLPLKILKFEGNSCCSKEYICPITFGTILKVKNKKQNKYFNCNIIKTLVHLQK